MTEKTKSIIGLITTTIIGVGIMWMSFQTASHITCYPVNIQHNDKVCIIK